MTNTAPLPTSAIAAAVALCQGSEPSDAGVALLAGLNDPQLAELGVVVAPLTRPGYTAVPGSPKDFSIRAIRRAQDLYWARQP